MIKYEYNDIGKILTFKTIFIFYLAFFFHYVYFNLVIFDSNFGKIYTPAVLFSFVFYGIDYIGTFVQYLQGRPKKTIKIGAFQIDMLDNVPLWVQRHAGKFRLVPSPKGYLLHIAIGFLLFQFFWTTAIQTGAVFAGVPSSFLPAELISSQALISGSVAPVENAYSLAFTYIFMTIIFAMLTLVNLGFKKKNKNNVPFIKQGIAVFVIVALVSSYLSGFYIMSPLHGRSYALQEDSLSSIGKFFTVGNFVSVLMGGQYVFDQMHFWWNVRVIESGRCYGNCPIG